METLADSSINTLQYIALEYEINWFIFRDDCIGPLQTVLSRQTNLETLKLKKNGISDE